MVGLKSEPARIPIGNVVDCEIQEKGCGFSNVLCEEQLTKLAKSCNFNILQVLGIQNGHL